MINQKVGNTVVLYKGRQQFAEYMYDSQGKLYYKLLNGQIIRDSDKVKEVKDESKG